MRPVDNLSTRMILILAGGLAAIVVLIATVLLLPAARGPGGVFDVPLPREALAIAEALEGAQPVEQGRILRAVNNSVVSARLQQDFPPSGPREDYWDGHGLNRLFESYAAALSDREFRVETRRRFLRAYIRRAGPVAPTIRLSVRLHDGQVLVVERRPSGVVITFVKRAIVLVLAVAAVLAVVLVLAVRQTTRPVSRLAEAVRRFAAEFDAPDLVPSGPREIRDLSADFNDMKHRIGELIAGRTRVLAAVAHDMRTYLTRLRLRVDFIDDPGQRDRAVRDIEEMSALLDDTLMFAGHDAQPPQRLRLDLVAELTQLTEIRAASGEPVDFVAPTEPLPVLGSPLAIRRMVGNLVDNAVRYGSAAHLTAGQHSNIAWIEVADDGPGVPQTDLDRILKPFERLEPSRAREHGGAGLGLAIVHGLSQAHGVQLALSNASGGGLVARLEFPLEGA